jgi:hypothetical protein
MEVFPFVKKPRPVELAMAAAEPDPAVVDGDLEAGLLAIMRLARC